MKKLTIYGRSGCKHCTLAKDMAKAYEIPFDYVALETKEEQKAFFTARPGIPRTVPQIYEGKRHIGGFSDLRQEILG